VRDFLLNEAMKRLAADAAVRLSALVAGGEQIPFDVAEQPGPESLFHSYEPLTSRFVLEREDEIQALPSFVPARNAVDAAGVAVAYLEGCGEPVPTDPAGTAAPGSRWTASDSSAPSTPSMPRPARSTKPTSCSPRWSGSRWPRRACRLRTACA
jgi:hypothetical protein